MKMIELELCNGNRILLPDDWSRIYNLRECTRKSYTFSRRFPFIKIIKKPYVSFRFMTTYLTLKDSDDLRLNVNCSLLQFASLFGVNVIQFEKALVDHDLSIA